MSDIQPDPAQDPTPTTTTEAPPDPIPAQGDDPAAEVERLRSELQKARKWEERAKTNAGAAKQLEELRKQHESDQDRAIREAVENARTQVFAELGSERVADAFRVAAAGRGLDVDDVDAAARSVLLRGKGGKQRLVPIGRPRGQQGTAGVA